MMICPSQLQTLSAGLSAVQKVQRYLAETLTYDYIVLTESTTILSPTPQSIHLLHMWANFFECLAMYLNFSDNIVQISLHHTIQKSMLTCSIFPTLPLAQAIHHNLTSLRLIFTLFQTKAHSFWEIDIGMMVLKNLRKLHVLLSIVDTQISTQKMYDTPNGAKLMPFWQKMILTAMGSRMRMFSG